MKLIAVGDWHKKIIAGVPTEWQMNRYIQSIDFIVDRCVKQGAILALLGDQLESIEPNKYELKLFNMLLHRLKEANITVLFVAGNHEKVAEGESILDYLGLSYFDNIVYRTNYQYTDVMFHLVNHDSIHSYTPTLDTNLRHVLLSHARCDIPPHIKEEINFKKFTAPYDLCLLGDIHSEIEFGNTYYTNNFVNKVFEERPVNGFLEVTIGKDIKVKRVRTNFPALVAHKTTAAEFGRLTFDPTDYHRVELSGTPEELRLITARCPNVKLVKLPIAPQSLTTEIEVTSQAEPLVLGDDLGNYLSGGLGYTESYTAAMLDEYGRHVDD